MENILYLMYFKNREKMKQRKKKIDSIKPKSICWKIPPFYCSNHPKIDHTCKCFFIDKY